MEYDTFLVFAADLPTLLPYVHDCTRHIVLTLCKVKNVSVVEHDSEHQQLYTLTLSY